jgi:hypothetical protein
MPSTIKPVVDEMFTASSIASTAGVTLVITLVTNTINQFSSKIQPKWIAIICATFLAFLSVLLKSSAQWYDWVLAVPNACLFFTSALGVTTGANRLRDVGKGVANFRPFFDRWL